MRLRSLALFASGSAFALVLLTRCGLPPAVASAPDAGGAR